MLSSVLASVFFLSVTPAVFGTVYLPGVVPNAFKDEERVHLKANKVTSTKTQVPYDYYDLPFCKSKHTHSKADNVGGRLSGDTATNSPYELNMKKDEQCAVLCRKSYKKDQMTMFRRMIDEEYRVHWLLDGLPVAVRNNELGYVTRGYPIGFKDATGKKERHFLFNHVSITIRTHEDPESFEGTRVVGFEVVPYSINHEYDSAQKDFDKAVTTLKTCNQFTPAQNNPQKYQAVDTPDEIVFTYDVKWEPSTITWDSRWDVYLHGNPDDEIHYFSIVNSLMIVLFLTGVVAMIMLRTLRKDISSYNDMQTLEEAQEESGWKLVHGDIFRPPAFSPMLLSVLAGTGLQLLAMTCVTIFCALLGLLSPANRGSLLTALLLLYVFMGSIAGFTSARIYKLFNGKEWKRNTVLTASLFPSIIAVIFLGINGFVQFQGSTAAAPFSTLLSVLFLWVGVSTPLVFIGSYFGFKKETIVVPVRTNQISRHVPDQVWYTHPLFSIALGGILPFGAVCIELFFIMSALWLHQYYYLFGFIFTVLVILIATCALITIVMCYFQLCNEDYHWWWRSFLSAGSSGLYLFLYSIYFFAKLEIEGFIPTVLYFSYMLMISLTFSIVTGAIGFFACLWFVRLIYSAIKVD